MAIYYVRLELSAIPWLCKKMLSEHCDNVIM